MNYLGFARIGQQHGGAAQGAVGRLGPYPHLRGPLRRRQHLLLSEAGLHFLSQPVPRTPTGCRKVHLVYIWYLFALSSDFNFFNLFQVSLSRMVIDIIKFTFLYLLVLFAFSCGEARLDK